MLLAAWDPGPGLRPGTLGRMDSVTQRERIAQWAPHSCGGAGFIELADIVMRETAAARLLTPNLR